MSLGSERQARSGWAVSSPNADSTAAGVAAFLNGGSAADAALAAAVSLTVTAPDNCALGGDLIALLREPSGELTVINASGPAPAATSLEELRRRHGRTMPRAGPISVTVPGLLAGWESLWHWGGRLPWDAAFGTAVHQARSGVRVAPGVAAALVREAGRLQLDAGLGEVFYPDGRPLGQGDLLVQPRLAVTLETIARQGAGAFYRGALGAAWLQTLGRLGSSLAPRDLSIYRPELTSPIRAAFGEQEVLTAPPNSPGALLLMILAAVDRTDPGLDPLSAQAPVLADAFCVAARAREAFLADPRHADVPIRDLLDLDAARMRSGSAGDPQPQPQPHAGDTAAVVAVDADGGAVSLLQSLFNSFGAGILDRQTGILAHNRGSLFSLDSESPNAIAPGKRPAHTLTPTLILERGELRAALATMGGRAQPQILTQVIQHLRRGASVADAVRAPRWLIADGSAAGGPGQVLVEAAVPAAAVQALHGTGWDSARLAERDHRAGAAQLIVRTPDGSLAAASDPRSDGSAHRG